MPRNCVNSARVAPNIAAKARPLIKRDRPSWVAGPRVAHWRSPTRDQRSASQNFFRSCGGTCRCAASRDPRILPFTSQSLAWYTVLSLEPRMKRAHPSVRRPTCRIAVGKKPATPCLWVELMRAHRQPAPAILRNDHQRAEIRRKWNTALRRLSVPRAGPSVLLAKRSPLASLALASLGRVRKASAARNFHADASRAKFQTRCSRSAR
jgi:hypothetical protein